MRIGQSHSSRWIVGCFETGERLPEALIELCRRQQVKAAQLTGQGILSSVVLDVYDLNRQGYASAFSSEGSFELLLLGGNVSMMGSQHILNLHAVIGLHEHGQNRVVGGQIREATVHWVEFAIQAFDDLVLERSLDVTSRLPVWKELEQPLLGLQAAPETVTWPESPPLQTDRSDSPPVPSAPPQGSGRKSNRTRAAAADPPKTAKPQSAAPKLASKEQWQQAAQQSQEILERKKSHLEDVDWESYVEIELEPGDIILHPKLGECKVVKVEDDTGAWIRINKSNRISKLALSMIKLERVGERDGVRIFRIAGGS
ncbi:MAG: DNA-binding protein [Bradymonadales bacterium]|nr:DNA-binding protein [Bradymonadales bacterium]